MIFRPITYRLLQVLLCVFIMMPPGAEAFIPQGPHLLEMMTRAIRQPDGLVVYQTRSIFLPDQTEAQDVRVEEKLVYSFPGRFRSDVTAGPHESLFVESNGRVLRVQDRETVGIEKTGPDRYIDILLYRDRKALYDYLQTEGMDVDSVSMKRHNDAVVFVLGTPPQKGHVSHSLWIDKDTFFPRKYTLTLDGLWVEILYDNWGIVSRTWYPMQISIYLNHQLFSTIHATGIALESHMSDSLFDIDGLADLYPLSPARSGENSDKIETLEENIEAFKKLYE